MEFYLPKLYILEVTILKFRRVILESKLDPFAVGLLSSTTRFILAKMKNLYNEIIF